MDSLVLRSSSHSFSLLTTDDLKPWLKWAYYASPMSYGQNAIAMNEFLDERWSTVSLIICFCNLYILLSSWAILSTIVCSHWNLSLLLSSLFFVVVCSLMWTPDSVHLQSEKSSSSRGASTQKIICFGFALEHSSAFQFSLTFYLLQHWHS